MNIQHFIILDLVKLNISRDCEKKMIDSKIDSKKKKFLARAAILLSTYSRFNRISHGGLAIP